MKTVLAPNAPWPSSAPKPPAKPKRRMPKPPSSSKRKQVDENYAQWLARETGAKL